MAEPTHDEKMAAANTALAAMVPPVTSDEVAPVTLDRLITVIWSQLALVPAAVAEEDPAFMPMLLEVLRPPTPELEARVKAHNAEGLVLAEDIHEAIKPPAE